MIIFENGRTASLNLFFIKLILIGDDRGKFDLFVNIFEINHSIIILFAELSAY